MTGLMVKDFCTLKKQMKIYIVFLAFYAIYGIAVKESSMFLGMCTMLSMILPISTFSWDEYVKWDKYAMALPLSPKLIVLSKYIVALLLETITIIIGLPLIIMIEFTRGEVYLLESLITCLVIVSVGIIFYSIFLPNIYYFGVEKARIILLILIAIPSVLIFLILNSKIPILNIEQLRPSKTLLELFPFILFGVAISSFVVSFFISVAIYKKKEF